MNLHMVNVVGQYKKIKSEIDSAIAEVFESGQFILGKEVGEFECQIAGYLGVKYAVGCASGTDALQVAMMAMGIQPGDEVITTPFTFVATTETIVLLGAKPVYVDIDARTFNIDPSKIERAFTPRTKAIIPVHLYGQSADMDPIMKIARNHGIKVIEDAAQAIGASYKARKVCTFGDVGCISFFPSKNLGAYGDAGMVVTNDQMLAERMKMITVHGSKVKYQHEILGVNSRLDTLQAVVLGVKLRYLEQWNSARQRFAARYDELLKGTPCVVPYVAPACQHVYHQYTIRVPHREGLVGHLKRKNIPHAIYYPIPLHLQPAFRVAGCSKGDFPVTEQACDEVISLPMHTELTEEQQVFITDTIKEFYAHV
jgi:UDP-2-acetamido-2-deoxy-ribo-hexuluronate aminotransferase